VGTRIQTAANGRPPPIRPFNEATEAEHSQTEVDRCEPQDRIQKQ